MSSYDDQAAANYGFNIDYNGTAINPATGQREKIYARMSEPGFESGGAAADWTDFRFASDPRGLTAQHQDLYGWAPGAYGYSQGTTGVEIGVLAGLAAMTGAAGGAAFGGAAGGAAAGEGAAAGAGAAEGGAAAGAAEGAGAGAAEGAAAGGSTAGAAEGAGAYGGFDSAAIAGADYGAGAAPSAAYDGIAYGGGGDAGAGATTMPPAQAAQDPTFGGTLTQTSPYAYENVGNVSSFGTTAPQAFSTTGGGSSAAAGAAGGTALSRILDGTATTADYLSIGGSLGTTALGVYGANRQAQSLRDLAGKYMEMGAPSRARYEGSFAPGFTMANDPGYTDALNQAAKGSLHGLSVNGNPADSPNAWNASLTDLYQKTAYPALQNYRGINANAGGLSSFAEAAPGAASSAINADAGKLNAIGAGAADIFNPPKSLAQILREARMYG
jgi:hypothetical protein